MKTPKPSKSPDLAVEDFEPKLKLETLRISLAHQFRLQLNTTLDQLHVWLLAQDFATNESQLRHHFIDRLLAQMEQLQVSPEILHSAIGKPTLTHAAKWSDLDEIIGRILFRFFGAAIDESQNALATQLGFPDEQYEFMIECVEKGKSLEKGTYLGSTIH
jgi:hypothetical protein